MDSVWRSSRILIDPFGVLVGFLQLRLWSGFRSRPSDRVRLSGMHFFFFFFFFYSSSFFGGFFLRFFRIGTIFAVDTVVLIWVQQPRVHFWLPNPTECGPVEYATAFTSPRLFEVGLNSCDSKPTLLALDWVQQPECGLMLWFWFGFSNLAFISGCSTQPSAVQWNTPLHLLPRGSSRFV